MDSEIHIEDISIRDETIPSGLGVTNSIESTEKRIECIEDYLPYAYKTNTDSVSQRFVLFGGDTFYPSGGFDDYISSHDTIRQAIQTAIDADEDWWHILDRETNSIATHGGRPE